MKTTDIHTAKARKSPVPVSKRRTTGTLPTTPSHPLMAPCENQQGLIAKRAYEYYRERGCRDRSALDDWLEAEREMLSQK